MVKTDDYGIDKLRAFEKQISVKVEENINSAVGIAQEILSMFHDLQEICETFYEVLEQREQELKSQQSINKSLEKKIEEQKIKIEKHESKADYYEKLELDSGKIVALLIANQQGKETLDRERERLVEERKDLEGERIRLVLEKDNAVNRANKYKVERDTAIHSRDEAIAEAQRLKEVIAVKEKEIEAKEQEIAEKEEEIKDKEKEKKANEEQVLKSLREEIQKRMSIIEENRRVSEELEWMKGYAEALDGKIIQYFRDDKKKELKNHFSDYLNNPGKWAEHRKHFPEFEGTRKKKEKEEGRNEEIDRSAERLMKNEAEEERKPRVQKPHTNNLPKGEQIL